MPEPGRQDSHSLELIVYKLSQLEADLRRYHVEIERRLDKMDASDAALAARVAALESWRIERTTKLEIEDKRAGRRDAGIWGISTGFILYVLKDAWVFFVNR